ncbi:MAG: isoprenylcysteine carboxylmethyltransferase family protein [Clostridia bacterium]|nr:isoprenylcysteine carboxylmethyltransferase family protein [Clostridia bacterium]MBQ9919212.1 isoprenylcysteine carboxylmethyltransferase family protein [Clostridia bacterium]
MKLLFSAIFKFLCGFIMVCLLIFLPAGSMNFFNGWIFITLLFVPMLILGIVMFIKSPELLKSRLDAKEKGKTQKNVVAFSAIIFIVGFVVAGLDFRFGLSDVPLIVVMISSVVLLVSYALYAEVMRENEYLSRTIKVVDNQKVVDTGFYRIVRHPMYAVTLLLFLSIPLVLGSWWSFLCFLLYIPVIVVRILNEEKILEEQLEGYKEYKTRIKYRLIPFVW